MMVQNTDTKIEHTLSIHGMSSKLTTIGFDITKEIDPLLEKFSCPTPSTSLDADITLQALSRVEDVPEWVLAAKRNLISRQAKQMGVVKRLKLNMSLFQDHDRLVVDLHEQRHV